MSASNIADRCGAFSMVRLAALGLCMACGASSTALAADKCRSLVPKIAQERCYAQRGSLGAGLDGERRRTQAVFYLRMGEAVAASLVASERCDEMMFNHKLAILQLKSFGYVNPEELLPFLDDVRARFDADRQLACSVAWAMHGPGARNDYRFLYLAGPKYADPRQSPPAGFVDAFDRSHSQKR